MNLRLDSQIEKQRIKLEEAILECKLVRASDLPAPDWIFYLELERIGPGDRYTRKWFHLDNTCQKDFSHIPEEDDQYKRKVKRTTNKKLCSLMQKRVGLTIELEKLTVMGGIPNAG